MKQLIHSIRTAGTTLAVVIAPAAIVIAAAAPRIRI